MLHPRVGFCITYKHYARLEKITEKNNLGCKYMYIASIKSFITSDHDVWTTKLFTDVINSVLWTWWSML
jgi:hypothetical protein